MYLLMFQYYLFTLVIIKKKKKLDGKGDLGKNYIRIN